MICDKCKKDIPDNSEFCPYCGYNLIKSESKKTNEQDVLTELESIKEKKVKQNNNATKTNTVQEPKKLICKK